MPTVRPAAIRTDEPTAAQIMSTPAIACSPDMPLHEVAELLADREISGVPVIDDSQVLLGVVSERDLARALGAPLIRLAIKRPFLKGPFLREPRRALTARDIMSTTPIVADPKTGLSDLAQEMVVGNVNRLPILEDGHLIGVVTRGDVLRALAGFPRDEPVAFQPPIVIGP